MKKFFLASVATLLLASLGYAQEEHGHSDIEFGYDDIANPTVVLVESDEFTSEGIQIIEAEFDSLGTEVFADSPGFITGATEGETGPGTRVNPDDSITVRFLNADLETVAGKGFVSYYNPSTGQLEAAGRLQIRNQTGASTVLDGEALSSGSETLLLSLGSDGNLKSNAPDEASETLGLGEIHNHLLFDLLDAPQAGAYGILIQFEADFADTSGNTDGIVDVTSEPFWLIFNNDMDDDVFDDLALAAFSEVVLPGDVDKNNVVDFDDISPFISLLSTGGYQVEADFDDNNMVDFDDIAPFIQALSGT